MFDFGPGDRLPELAGMKNLARFYTFEWHFGESVVLLWVKNFTGWDGQESERVRGS